MKILILTTISRCNETDNLINKTTKSLEISINHSWPGDLTEFVTQTQNKFPSLTNLSIKLNMERSLEVRNVFLNHPK